MSAGETPPPYGFVGLVLNSRRAGSKGAIVRRYSDRTRSGTAQKKPAIYGEAACCGAAEIRKNTFGFVEILVKHLPLDVRRSGAEMFPAQSAGTQEACLIVAKTPDFRAVPRCGREYRAAPPRNDDCGGPKDEGRQQSRHISGSSKSRRKSSPETRCKSLRGAEGCLRRDQN